MLVVYHSQSGSAAKLAAAGLEGALEHDPTVRFFRAVDAGAPEVLASTGLLLVCAENSGRLAGAMKDFLDRIFYPLSSHQCSLPYALLVSAGNDGRGAVTEAQRIFKGIPFTQALEPLIIRGVPDKEGLQNAREYGAGFAAGLEMGIF